MLLLGKIMILQGVGHPISCLGVCYANDPKKGGYTPLAPALDLTTSLRGDLECDGSLAPPPPLTRQGHLLDTGGGVFFVGVPSRCFQRASFLFDGDWAKNGMQMDIEGPY